MRRHADNLLAELRSAGAGKTEAGELLAVARSLKKLKNHEDLSAPAFKFQNQSAWKRLIPAGLAFSGVAIGAGLVILSQTALPGSMLYSAQKLSDDVSVLVDPGFRGSVMMKRALEVRRLIAGHADPGLVLATLADYEREAAAYKPVLSNYAAFEYCKSNLLQAADMAPDLERQAINKALSTLKDT